MSARDGLDTTRTADPGVVSTLLGSDWTWTYDARTALWRAAHRGGLVWVVSSTIAVRSTPVSAPVSARAFADCLLDAVEDGVKGEVEVVVGTDGALTVRALRAGLR